ncbi:DUF6299 family protein [Streptomyces sp. NPDC044780]|uniref:DUF6299 family protein n=1 Tax=unclassified Streptomyces TaxID=2593676 RepID=UPI0033DE9063
MRNRRRALGALIVLLMAAPAAHAAPSPGWSGPAPRGERSVHLRQSALWTDDLTIDRTGDVTPDGSVTLYGSYRCAGNGSEGLRASVLVTLVQGRERHGLGGYEAVCDGWRHRWVIDGTGVGRYVRGPADVEGVLLKYGFNDLLGPVPRNVAGIDQKVRLVADDD